MLLDHCYAFALLFLPSGLKKKFLKEGDPRDLFLPRPGSAPEQIRPKTTTLARDHEYFITTKFRKHPSSGSVEKADYVSKYIQGVSENMQQLITSTKILFLSGQIKVIYQIKAYTHIFLLIIKI